MESLSDPGEWEKSKTERGTEIEKQDRDRDYLFNLLENLY